MGRHFSGLTNVLNESPISPVKIYPQQLHGALNRHRALLFRNVDHSNSRVILAKIKRLQSHHGCILIECVTRFRSRAAAITPGQRERPDHARKPIPSSGGLIEQAHQQSRQTYGVPRVCSGSFVTNRSAAARNLIPQTKTWSRDRAGAFGT